MAEDSGSHPIQGLMQTTMESIKNMVDVNTILGDPVETPDGTVILPVSRVSFGFAAGGSEFEPEVERKVGSPGFPFGGGSGAGISLSPVGFLVVGNGQVRLLPVWGTALHDRLIDIAPKMIDQLSSILRDGRPGLFERHNGGQRSDGQRVGAPRTEI